MQATIDGNLRLVLLPTQGYLRSLDSSVEIRLILKLLMNKHRRLSVNSRVQLHQKQRKIPAHEKLLDKTRSVNDAYVRTQKHFATLMTNFQTQIQSQDSQLKHERSLNSDQKVTVASTRLQSYSTSCQQQFHKVMISKLTHVKSPLVLVCSKDVDKLLSGLNIS